jgi:hypothetical protein
MTATWELGIIDVNFLIFENYASETEPKLQWSRKENDALARATQAAIAATTVRYLCYM